MSQVIVVDPVTVQTPVTNNCCPAGDLNSTHQHGVGVDRPITDVSLFARGPYLLVRSYQWLFAGRISPCRFEPSCSTYALESFEVHGFIRGSFLSLRRLARCHPWGGHGWDPVPRKKAA